MFVGFLNSNIGVYKVNHLITRLVMEFVHEISAHLTYNTINALSIPILLFKTPTNVVT